ncbi:hypothetical protein MMK73_000194 [Providencia rettgeri]|nr:hypothetical protein [Providencia rettgeri]
MDYYIDTLVDRFGFHSIHQFYCDNLPKDLRKLYLGNFDNTSSAISVAKTYFFPKVKGCDHCCQVSKKKWKSTYMSLVTKS